jgi:HK97 family phage portal protein
MLFWTKKHTAPAVPTALPAPKANMRSSQMAAWSGRLQARWTPRRYDKLADEGYTRNVVAFRCIRDIASSAASIPLLLYKGEREVIQHPLLKLLNRPNPTQSGASFREALFSHLLTAGNAYVEAVGAEKPVELWTLRPDRMQVIPSPHGVPAGYEYRVGGQKKQWVCDVLSGYAPILHLKHFHPLDDWYGFSPIEAAAAAIDQFNSAAAWNQALLQNGARPSGALCVKHDDNTHGTLTSEQYDRLKEELENVYSGAANAGRPLLLEGGLSWVDMMLSPKDMDFLNTKHTAARDIALAFGYPPMLLGIPGDNTYSNQKEARLALWEQTILPLASHVLEALNHWLTPSFGSALRLGYDEDAIHALQPRRDSLWQRLSNASFLSDDEKRIAAGYGARGASRTAG